jgi:hypothetical protein
MTTHPRERTDERFCLLMREAERMRRRAWQQYLDVTRASDSYKEAEPEAWNRLQERLAGIDEQLMQDLAVTP